MAKNVLKLSTMVGENFEIYYSQIAKNDLKHQNFFPESTHIFKIP